VINVKDKNSQRLFDEPPVLISTWEELANAKSETHYIEVLRGCGHVRSKVPVPENSEGIRMNNIYLSSHTFYEKHYNYVTKLLRNLGFNVQLKNWDGETIYCQH
jgi:hypothetical protein